MEPPQIRSERRYYKCTYHSGSGQWAAALQEGTESLMNPGHLLELGTTATEYAADSATLLARALSKPNDPLTPLKGKLGVSKRVAWSRGYNLAETKRICAALGCKINDVLAGALAEVSDGTLQSARELMDAVRATTKA